MSALRSAVLLIVPWFVSACGPGSEALVDEGPDGSQQQQDIVGSSITQLTDLSIADGVNFDRLRTRDFDGDGRKDTVSCTAKGVVVFKDDDRTSELYRWDRPADQLQSGGFTLQSGKCDIVDIVEGAPSVVQALFWATSSGSGERKRAAQAVFLNTGLVNGKPRIVRRTPANYLAVARGVGCFRYNPYAWGGTTPGALCLFGGYRDDFDGISETHTALLKFEASGDTLVTRDLTPSSGLPWSGGINGTAMTSFSEFTMECGARKHDGYQLMDATMFHVDGDNLPDLVTVGQHSSVWSFFGVKDTRYPEGVRFRKVTLQQASSTAPTEFLRVNHTGEIFQNIESRCVLISGEYWDQGAPICGKVRDHLWCFKAGAWRRMNLPLEFSSAYKNGAVNRHPTLAGKLLLKTSDSLTGQTLLFQMTDAPP